MGMRGQGGGAALSTGWLVAEVWGADRGWVTAIRRDRMGGVRTRPPGVGMRGRSVGAVPIGAGRALAPAVRVGRAPLLVRGGGPAPTPGRLVAPGRGSGRGRVVAARGDRMVGAAVAGHHPQVVTCGAAGGEARPGGGGGPDTGGTGRAAGRAPGAQTDGRPA